MRKKLLTGCLGLMIALSGFALSGARAASDYDGQVVKMDGQSTLYYVIDGKRYVFPNEKTYKSWFTGYDDVVTLSAEQIYTLPLAGNVKYRPGVILVKITTDPKVYAVGRNGLLRWVKTEALAKKLYGDNWNLLIDDVPDSFFTNYMAGGAIETDADYDADTEVADNDTIEEGHGLALGHAKQSARATTGKCRAVPAVPATPGKKGNGKTVPAIPAVPARECKGHGGNSDDTVAPVISGVTATTGTATATVSWTTNEKSDSGLFYATSSLATAVYKLNVYHPAMTTNHVLNMTGLTASTTYYYMIKVKDLADNVATSTEKTFKTKE